MNLEERVLKNSKRASDQTELTQGTVPASFATGIRAGTGTLEQRVLGVKPASVSDAELQQIYKEQIPYTVNQSDYESYVRRTKEQKRAYEQSKEDLLPSTAQKSLSKSAQGSFDLMVEGGAQQAYAGATKQNQSENAAARRTMLESLGDVEATARHLSQYARDVDYQLAEKVNTYADWSKVFNQYLQSGDAESARIAADYARGHYDKGTSDLTQEAVGLARDETLQDMLKQAGSKGQRSIIQAEIDRKAQEKERGREAALQSEELTALQSKEQELAEHAEWLSNNGYAGSDELIDTWEQLGEVREQITQEQERLQKEYDESGEWYGPEAPAVYEWQSKAEAGELKPFSARWEEEQSAQAAGWQAAVTGEYTGDDPAIRQANDAFIAAYSAWEEAKRNYDAVYNEWTIDSGEEWEARLHAAEQQLEETQTVLDSMIDQAEQNAESAREASKAITEAINGKGTWGRFLGAASWQGVTDFADGFYKTIDLFFGKPVTEVGKLIAGDKDWKSPLTKWSEQYSRDVADKAREETAMATQALGGGLEMEILASVISNTVAQIPDFIMMGMTAGMSNAAGALVMQQKAATAELSKTAVKTGSALRQTARAAKTIAQEALKNPSFWTSYMRETGPSYDEAIEDGASPLAATVYALVKGTINSMIEVGGDSGFQRYALLETDESSFIGKVIHAVRGRDIPWLEKLLESATEEGFEEIKQSFVEGLAAKALFDYNRAWISTNPEAKAVFNLPNAAKEGLIGAVSGGVLGVGMTPISNTMQKKAETKALGESIITNDWSEALLGLAEDSAHIHNATTEAMKAGTLDVTKESGLRKVGALYRQTYAALDNASRKAVRGTLKGPMRRALEGVGYDGDMSAATEALIAAYSGDKLTRKQRALLGDERVARAFEAAAGTIYTPSDSDAHSIAYAESMQDAVTVLREMPEIKRVQLNAREARDAADTGAALASKASTGGNGANYILDMEPGTGREDAPETLPSEETEESPEGEAARKMNPPPKKAAGEDVRVPGEEQSENSPEQSEYSQEQAEETQESTQDTQEVTQAPSDETQETQETPAERKATAEDSGKEIAIVGATVQDGQVYVRGKTDSGEIILIPYEKTNFANRQTAERVAVAALVGNDQVASAILNAKLPGGANFSEYATQFLAAYMAASAGASKATIKAGGQVSALQDAELDAAVKLGKKADAKNLLRKRGSIRAWLSGVLETAGMEGESLKTAVDALVKTAQGEQLSSQESAVLGGSPAAQQVAATLAGETLPFFGAETAYQYGLSGRSMEELQSTLGEEAPSEETRREYERGRAEQAERETKRIRQIQEWNRGQNGTRRGVVRSIRQEEADAKGVQTISGPLTKAQRAAITALRGLAETTGLNIVLYESQVQEGTHVGEEGWYDPSTQTIYLDIFAGYGNERAMLRAMSHELTHFIKDWSPAQYRRLRDFLLEYYYGTGKDTVKRLVQQEIDTDSTLSESDALEEVVCRACETMLGDADAVRKLAEKHTRLFVRIRGWLDRFCKALTKAWHGLGAHSEAAKLLGQSAEKMQEAQRIWYEALEDASVSLRGEVRVMAAEEARDAKIAEMREKAKARKAEAEARRQAAIAAAEQAKTAQEARAEADKVQAAAKEQKTIDAQEKAQEKQAKAEEKTEKQDAERRNAAARMIEKRLEKLPETARAYVESYAEQNAIALDGSMDAGTELVKAALHYYNQGKANIDYRAMDGDSRTEFGQQMNAYGQQTHETETLEAAAETQQKETTPVTEAPVLEEEAQITPQEEKAAEAHEDWRKKTAEIIRPMSRVAKNLFKRWAANEQVNIRIEQNDPRAVMFANYAMKWYNAGKEGTRVNRVPFEDGLDTEYPVFLQDEFYKAGKADAEAEAKRAAKKKGAKANENAADQGTVSEPERNGNGAGGILAEVPAENVQEPGSGRDAVRAGEEQGRPAGGGDAGPDRPGTVRERGAGDRERGAVQPEAGEEERLVTPEAEEKQSEAEAQEALEETVEETQEQLEAETPRGTNYRIGDSLNLPSGEKARFKANVEAIRLLQQLEAESRYATEEEQEILSKYVGWGGLAQAFDESNEKWKKEYELLRGLLTEEEYKAAKASTLNAHYTSIEVIRAMYEGLRHLGFDGGRMLEPSGGIGHFIGAMPADMQQKVRSWTMVELDSITGRIAAKLYPNADVRVQGFETANIGDNLMDVAIGNVPFGNFPITDKRYPGTVTSAIHNYFFAKAIDKVRPGGILMFITSRYTMDAQTDSVRQYMMERADLLGAVRLPDTAFKGNAGTEVVTDILVFKKRAEGTAYRGEAFKSLQWQQFGTKWEGINEYFSAHPEMVLGTPEMTGSMYGRNQLTYKALPGDLGAQVKTALEKIEGKMDYSQRVSVEELRKRAEKARANTKENGFEVKNGKVYQNVNGELQAVDMKEQDAERVKGMLAIRDAARELQEMQKRGDDEKTIRAQRKKLNDLYDAFVKKNGVLHDNKNSKLMESDPDRFFILALENYDKKQKTTTKADIFDRNTIAREVTITHAETPQDALGVVLNEKGYIDPARVAELLGVTAEQATNELLEDGLAFLKADGTLETRENYLSGNVRAKLREAESLATVDERYQRNVDALKQVIPETVPRESIHVQIGATWIPESVYETFIANMLGVYNSGWKRRVTVKYMPQSGEYTIDMSADAKNNWRNKEEWGTQHRTFKELMEAMLNSRQISVYDKTEDGGRVLNEAATLAAREKAEKIQQRFAEWLWEDKTRGDALETLYNDKYNAIVTPDYDGSSLTIAGSNADKQLRPHQKNVVHRIIQSGGNTLIAHCVGAGKTAEMAGAAMKLRQLGIVQKPVFVVPKALVAQWGREFLDFFPAARILVLSEKDFTAKNRKEFANRIATGDYDAVIMSREQYSHIPMTPEYEKAFYQQTIDEITAGIEEEKIKNGGKGSSVKNMEKTKKRLEAKLKKLETRARDENNIYFEDMGIDSIFVDEAHEYKNLFFTSNMNNISGLGNRDGSQRAFDMYMKTRWLRQLNGGRGIVFATATPVMNSMSEMYIMQKYLQEDTLRQLGIYSFDAWASLFGEVMNVIEPTPSGKGYRQKQAFARFKNLPELQRLFRSFADVKTKIDGLKVPKMRDGKRITVECEPGQFQLDYIDKLAERADRMKNGHVDPREDNMLKITSEGRKLSYTQRMIDPSLPYEEGCKIVECANRVAEIWKQTKANKGTQLIFCDMATPKGSANFETDADEETSTAREEADAVDIYGDIKRMLMAQGVPAKEIAFIHEADTNDKKTKLFDDVNEGRVRVLIGSTGKMGVGMNAQKRVVALHHLDAPWRPGDIEQREGRALRQGNMNDEVGVYVYVTKRTFDTRMWDNLYRKASFINQIMNGTNTAREVEGDGDFALSAAEIKAIATGDPMIVEQFEVNNQIKKLEALERAWSQEKRTARKTIATNNEYISAYEHRMPDVEKDRQAAKALEDKPFSMTVGGVTYDSRAKAAKALLEALKKHDGILKTVKIGSYGGFDLYTNGQGSVEIRGTGNYSVNYNLDSDTGTMTRVLNKINGLQENLNAMRAQVKQWNEENAALEKKLDAPFEKADELAKLRQRAQEIADILNPVEDQAGADALGEEEEEQKVKKSLRPPVPLKEDEYARNQKEVVEMQPVAKLKGDEFKMGTGTLEQDVLDYYQKNNLNTVIVPYVGEVTLDKKSMWSSRGHGMTPIKAAAYAAVPDVLTKGKIVDYQKGWKGQPRDTIVIAAPITISGTKYLMGAIVNRPHRSMSQRYYTHDLVGFEIVKMEQPTQQKANVQAKDGIMLSGYPTIQRLLQNILDVNTKNSERDTDTLSDRQLLTRAYEGLAKTENEKKALQKYQAKIAQLDADTERMRELKKTIHEKTFIKGKADRAGAQAARVELQMLMERTTKADKTLLQMERSAALRRVLEVERSAAAKKMAEKIKGQLKRYNEGVTRREYAERIKKVSERLAKWIAQPDKNNHVPKALQASIAGFILSIQQSEHAKFTGEGGAKRERNFLQNLNALQGIVSEINAYQFMNAEERVREDFGMYIDLPDGFTEQMAELVRRVEREIGDARGYAVDLMSAESLKELYQVLSTISASVTQANDLLALNSFKHVSEAAQNSVEYIRDQGRVANGSPSAVHNFLSWENTQPIRAFARFGEGGEAIFKGLQRGQAQHAFNVARFKALSYEAFTGKESKAWSKEIKTFNIGGKTISMPVADVMSLYCLMKRQQAVGHLLGEGFRVADFKKGNKTIAGTGVTITQDEAKAITDTLTERQKAVADRLQQIMSTVGSEWGNYVSMKRFGYEMFTEKNYFPIEVDSDRLTAKTDESKGNELYRLLNISSVKPITRGARNRIMIKNIFEVFASHMSDMAQYNAYGLPVLDAVKWINYRTGVERDDGTVVTDGVRDAAREMYGRKAPQYIINLLKDVNGVQAGGDIGETISRKMLMRYNRQAVAANLSVAAKQPLSIIRAGMELGGTDIILGIMGNKGLYKQNVQEMLQYSGIAVWKDLGFYDVNVSRPVKEMIMRNESALDALVEKATFLAEKADKITWAAMWGASKRFVERSGRTFASTEEFMQAVAEKFEDVIYKTQVVDSILTRSQFMRGTSFQSKMFSSFMSEPTTTYNMLLDVAHRFLNDIRKGDSWGRAFVKNGQTIARTAAVYFISAAVMTLLEALIGAWRDDDDYETLMEKFQAGLLDNALDEFMPASLLPVVSDMYDYAKKLVATIWPETGISGYGQSSVVYAALEDVTDTISIIRKIEEGTTNYTAYGVAYKAAKALSEFTGVPVAPAMREVVAIWNNIAPNISPRLKLETYESSIKSGAKALYNAIRSGDKEWEATVRAQLEANGHEGDKLDTAVRAIIKEELTAGRITGKEAESALVELTAMEADDAYFKVQEWSEGGESYSRFDTLKEAIISGNGISAAVKELTSHGYTEEQVQTRIRSTITEATVSGQITDAQAQKLLKQYGGMTENEAWIRTQELQYQRLTGTSTTADIAMVAYAIDKGNNPKTAIDGLLAHGKEKSAIASAITSRYKQQYLELVKTNKSQAATLKGRLISVFEYLGYDGTAKIHDWETAK